MTDRLVALANGREMGEVRRERGRLRFAYAAGWREARGAYPLSLSMPLAAAEHGHAPVDAFLWGLLPDNATVLDRWAKRFQVSARSPFALMAHVGEDCAGAVQFVRPDRLEAVIGQGPAEVEWLDESGVAGRLRALRSDHAAWRSPRDTGQFSLAGAQPKTALLLEEGRWGVPAGRTPTTHILKPPTGTFDGHAENEHLCMRLAAALGLSTARSEVARFKDEVAIVVERYDRRRTPSGFVRVHQEDMCQALGIIPSLKYQNEGGPGAEEIVKLLRAVSSRPEEDVGRFCDALAFNWLIGGTDAHAKNYSLLIGAGARARLAPLYDVASILPYDDIDLNKAKLAMRIGREYRLRDIGVRHWARLAEALRLDPEALRDRLLELAKEIPDHLRVIRREAERAGLVHPLIGKLGDVLISRAERCAEALDASAARPD